MKQPLVSVIVPTKNSGEYIEACLKSIKSQTFKNIELIVVDNHSSDETQRIAKRYADKLYTKGPERSAQRNYGVKQSSGKYIAIIDSDMVLTTFVIKSCVETILNNKAVKAIVIPEESFGEGFWAQCKKLERSFYVGIDWMEASRFFDRSTFNEFAGYNEDNTGTEDYDLPQRIEEMYGQSSIARISSLILHNEQRLSLLKTFKKKFYYSQKLGTYQQYSANLVKYKKQANPIYRYTLFFSKPKKLFRNPLLGAGMLFMKTGEFLAGGIGRKIEVIIFNKVRK